MKVSVSRDDSQDLYNRRLRPVLWICVVLWVVVAFGLRRTHNTHLDGKQSISRDSGLQMTLKEPFPPLLLTVHSVGGAALLVGCMVQKELVRQMAEGRMTPYASLHGWVGMFCMACMIAMFVAGFAMGPYSSWDHFELFSFFFAAPWAVWTVTIFVTARMGQFHWHRLFANQCLKGCITVPAARLMGALVQKYAPQLGEANGYYVGIGAVTALIGLWEMVDIYFFVLRPCAVNQTNRGKLKKME